MNDFDLDYYAANGERLHFIGICGVSMRAIAGTLQRLGCTVTGSDREDGPAADQLRASGIPVLIGHKPEYVRGAAAVVRNAAIHDDSPDITEARRLGIPIFERPQVLGAIMKRYSNPVCIAGTHGKTTATAMTARIAIGAGLDPAVYVGADFPFIGGTYRFGSGSMMIAESCEYCDSFLSFFPKTAVILNIEADHLDYFSGIEQIMESFRRFVLRTPSDGLVIYNADDDRTVKALTGVERDFLPFGIQNGRLRADRITLEHGFAQFDLVLDGKRLCTVKNGVPGYFNIYNALAASAASLRAGCTPEQIAQGLADFRGASRRFEIKGAFNGAILMDDYAHHPSELAATLNAVRDMGYRRIICIFQPHTYSRTAALKEDFIKSLRLADVVILAPIYSAREIDTGIISSAAIAAELDGAIYMTSFRDIANYLCHNASEGDLILTAGAGDIFKVHTYLTSPASDTSH